MRLGVLFSGGKDSSYATFLAKKQGHELICLITILSENSDSYMFQHVSQGEIEKLGERVNLPVIFQETKGEKEKELLDLREGLKIAKEKYQIEGIVTGAVASNYQLARIQKLCDALGLVTINPLWGIDAEEYWKLLLKDKFKVKIVKVAADGLTNEWLGKIIDKKNLEKLKKLSKKFRFDLRFEGGEAETQVMDCPLFKE
jgi:ABC transporter with metal-binding/Fe-S-binding domain ATP-binding protein